MTSITNMPSGKLRHFLLHQLFKHMLQRQASYWKNSKCNLQKRRSHASQHGRYLVILQDFRAIFHK